MCGEAVGDGGAAKRGGGEREVGVGDARLEGGGEDGGLATCGGARGEACRGLDAADE